MLRRAQPLLGTLVEVGAPVGSESALQDALNAIAVLQAQLSRFEPESEIARFNALPAGSDLQIGSLCLQALEAAQRLRDDSDGLFDVSLGTGVEGWRLTGNRLRKLHAGVLLDLGGIAKGQAVDLAVETLRLRGCACGWVNAGGDLRVFGDLEVPVMLRDEAAGGTREFARLQDGAFATSHYAADSRSTLSPRREAHVSVAAPRCLWADALTKVIALSGCTDDPILSRYDARAWRHDAPRSQ